MVCFHLQSCNQRNPVDASQDREEKKSNWWLVLGNCKMLFFSVMEILSGGS